MSVVPSLAPCPCSVYFPAPNGLNNPPITIVAAVGNVANAWRLQHIFESIKTKDAHVTHFPRKRAIFPYAATILRCLTSTILTCIETRERITTPCLSTPRSL